MSPKSIHLICAIAIGVISIGWLVDRNELIKRIDVLTAEKSEQTVDSNQDETQSEPDYKNLKEYELYDRYLNEPNQIWITYRITRRILNETRSVEKSLSDELVTNLWKLWKHEKQYNISEWGIEHHSSIKLASLMLNDLRCSTPNDFRALIKQHSRFQLLEDSDAEAVSWLGPGPEKIYPEFHQPTTAEYRSFDDFLSRAFADQAAE